MIELVVISKKLFLYLLFRQRKTEISEAPGKAARSSSDVWTSARSYMKESCFLLYFSVWSWLNSTTFCSGCSCSETRGLGRPACCAGSRRVNSTRLISPPSVSQSSKFSMTSAKKSILFEQRQVEQRKHLFLLQKWTSGCNFVLNS